MGITALSKSHGLEVHFPRNRSFRVQAQQCQQLHITVLFLKKKNLSNLTEVARCALLASFKLTEKDFPAVTLQFVKLELVKTASEAVMAKHPFCSTRAGWRGEGCRFWGTAKVGEMH
eukprot:6190780-Pleurochrysis_carterae.AAC.7